MELSRVRTNQKSVQIQFRARKGDKVLGTRSFTVHGAGLNEVYTAFLELVLKTERATRKEA